MRRPVTAGWLALACVAFAACSLFSKPPAGLERNGWVWPAPAQLPPGAIAVAIDVATIPDNIRPGVEIIGCSLALLGPVTPEYQPGRDPPVTYRAAGAEVLVRWPVGFSARLAPNLEIVAPDGKVIARAGEATEGLIGGYLGDDDVFSVCIGEYGPKRVGT